MLPIAFSAVVNPAAGVTSANLVCCVHAGCAFAACSAAVMVQFMFIINVGFTCHSALKMAEGFANG